MHHPGSTIWCRDMDITVLQREKIGCLPSWMPMTRPLDKVVWSCLRPVGQDYPPLGTSSYAVRHMGPFGLVAQLDSNVRDRDALECSYEMRPPSCWRRPPGRSGQTCCTRLVLAPCTASIHKNAILQTDVDVPGERYQCYGPLPPKHLGDDDEPY